MDLWRCAARWDWRRPAEILEVSQSKLEQCNHRGGEHGV